LARHERTSSALDQPPLRWLEAHLIAEKNRHPLPDVEATFFVPVRNFCSRLKAAQESVCGPGRFGEKSAKNRSNPFQAAANEKSLPPSNLAGFLRRQIFQIVVLNK
jgi:hypothetical protein